MTPHPGEALSAMLDGELSPAEEAAVGEHVATCAECAVELSAVREARSLLRGLPPAEPPFGFLPRLARPHHLAGRTTRRRAGMAALAAMAAASVGVLFLASPSEEPVSPQMTRLVEAHATSAAGDPISQLAPVGVPVSLGR